MMMQTSLDRCIQSSQGVAAARVTNSTVTITTIVLCHLHWHIPLMVIVLMDELPPAAIYAAIAFKP